MTIFTDRNLTLAALTGAIMFGCVLYLPLLQETPSTPRPPTPCSCCCLWWFPVVVMFQLSGRTMSRAYRSRMVPFIGMDFIIVVFMIAGTLALSTMTVGAPRLVT
jgi:hypothetical protein